MTVVAEFMPVVDYFHINSHLTFLKMQKIVLNRVPPDQRKSLEELIDSKIPLLTKELEEMEKVLEEFCESPGTVNNRRFQIVYNKVVLGKSHATVADIVDVDPRQVSRVMKSFREFYEEYRRKELDYEL